MNYQLTTSRYATVYDCSVRSIWRLRRDDAPLDDPKAMLAWWASKKLTPPAVQHKGLPAILADYSAATAKPVRPRVAAKKPVPAAVAVPAKPVPPAPPDVAAVLTPEDLQQGAAHALRRLESMELRAGQEVDSIDKIAEPLRYKTALDAYIKISESLLKYERQVEASKRDAGELVPRGDAEIAVEMSAHWLRLAVRTFINGYVPRLAKAAGDLPAIQRLIEDGMGAGVRTSLLRCTDCRVPLPPWALAAVRRGYNVPQPAECAEVSVTASA